MFVCIFMIWALNIFSNNLSHFCWDRALYLYVPEIMASHFSAIMYGQSLTHRMDSNLSAKSI